MSEETTMRGAGASEIPEVDDKLLLTAVDGVETPTLEASLSAIASAKAGSISATGSAVGMASSAGDFDAQLSVVVLGAAKGMGSVKQSYVSAFVASDGLAVSQSVVPLGVAKTIIFEQSGAIVVGAAETKVRGGFVGLLLSGHTDIADDSRVLMDTRAAIIVACALLGGLGLVALALYLSAKRLTAWRPAISMPSLRDLPKALERFRR
ncbi:MAG TPA: hypothetical protein VFG89_09395 [Coriobacteriia bacterium]|nr:hypothetical protein [Coriobacteriia bacterium]